MKQTLITLMCSLLAVCAFAQNQNITVSGKVTDATGEPLAGASVLTDKGTGNVTDADGAYSLTVPQGTTLTFSFVSYKSKTITVNGEKTVYDVVLEDDNEFLEETIVVGYGTTKKANLTGAVAQVDSKALESRPITNVSQGIQGLMPGITVTGTAGAPGMDAGNINIRGVGTLNSSSPYILIDGVESGNMNSLDPDDIASISVLKDASSAAIYGSKASNGVILITTKRGKTGPPKVTYTGFAGIQNATCLVERMNSADQATLYNNLLTSEGKPARFTDEEIQHFRDGDEPYKYPNTDWYKLAYRTGVQTRHNISINGGSDFSRYMASVGYLYQQGVLPNSGRQQFNARTNVDMDVAKPVTIHLNLSFIKNDYRDASSAYAGGSSDQIIRQLNRMAPWIVNQYPDGSYGTITDGNPIAWLDSGMQVKRDNMNFTGLLGVDYRIIKQLTAKASFSYVEDHQRYDYFQKYIKYNENKESDPASLTVSNTNWKRFNFDAQLDYDQSFGKHNLKGLAGFHAEKYTRQYDWAYRKGFPNNELTDMDAGDASSQKNSGNSRELSMVSWFARINYDYDGRYLFEANIRADASSRFAPEYRWGYFPSFSAAWRISEEAFMAGAKDWLTNLKIRGSWGQLGNQNALNDYYPALNTYSTSGKYVFDGTLYSGYYQNSYHIPNISWEKATTWGVGLDFDFGFGLSGSVDYYDRTTTGIIMDVATPAEFALGAYKENIGAMRNNGVEVSLAYRRQFGTDWHLNISGNFAYNKNRILDLGEGVEFIENGGRRNAVGHQINNFYMYEWSGEYFNSQEEADEYTAKYGNPFGVAFKAGDLKYNDTNGDGKLTSDDRVYTKYTDMPSITFNLNLGFTWKNLDFSMMFQGAGCVAHIFNGEVYGEFSGDAGHPATIWKNAWTPENTNAKMPRIYEPRTSPSDMAIASSTFWLKNTSYVRLKNLQLGYTFRFKKGIERLRIYYAGENLFTIDGLDIKIDPETTSERASSFPLLRTHSIGLNIGF